jgi:imidazolonepropionase-like amidohydrolase
VLGVGFPSACALRGLQPEPCRQRRRLQHDLCLAWSALALLLPQRLANTVDRADAYLAGRVTWRCSRWVGMPVQPTRRLLIQNARIFDGITVLPASSVLVRGPRIEAVAPGIEAADGVTLVDGRGGTLLPGLIDAHAHVKPPVLEQAIAFGVTTVLDCGSLPEWMDDERTQAATRNDVADVRSASVGATVPGGHPSRLIGSFFPRPFPTITSAEDIPRFVADRLAEGADYIKLIVDSGSAKGTTLPTLSPALLRALVDEAHRNGLLAVVHVTELEATWQALRAGADGLAHIFHDRPPDGDVARALADSGLFIMTTVGLLQRDRSAKLADDARAAPFLDELTKHRLRLDIGVNQQVRQRPHQVPSALECALETMAALRAAGATLLAGTDASGGVGAGHGATLHMELELLVSGGLTPIEALRAATSAPAERFSLADRGRIAPSLQADLLLVDGDPTTRITDTLSIRAVWRRGERLDRDRYREAVRARDELAQSQQ